MKPMNNPLSGIAPKWVIAAGIIVALLIPTVIVLTRVPDSGESETTSVTIHDPCLGNDHGPHFAIDIVHEVKSTYRYGSWLYVPSGGERYLILTYCIDIYPLDFDYIRTAPETTVPHPIGYGAMEKIKGSDIQVIVPYMPSGGNIGVIFADVVNMYENEAIIEVVVVFSAPEYRSWSISSAEVVLSNLNIFYSTPRAIPSDLFPSVVVEIETEVTSSLPALPD